MCAVLFPRFLRKAQRCAHALMLSGALLLSAPLIAHAQNPLVTGTGGGAPVNPTVVNGNFTGGVPAGTIRVEYSSAVEVYGGAPTAANNIAAGAGNFQTILAGMTITAQATAIAPYTGLNWAWMQAVTSYSAPTVVRDANGGALAAPFPDTPPGGYQFQPFGVGPATIDPWDREPWYGNNSINQLDLYDQPRNFISPAGATTINFESWLVCVTAAQGPAPGAYTVLPLVGFTWGFTYNYGNDAAGNNNGTLGDDIREYTGATSFGGLTQGGQPSAAFKNGYAKSWNITYLNNPQDCELCLATQAPEPGSSHLILFMLATGSGLLICGILRLRREA